MINFSMINFRLKLAIIEIGRQYRRKALSDEERERLDKLKEQIEEIINKNIALDKKSCQLNYAILTTL